MVVEVDGQDEEKDQGTDQMRVDVDGLIVPIKRRLEAGFQGIGDRAVA